MKKVLRWFAGIAVVLLLLVIAAFSSIDRIAKSIAEKRLRDETGMEAQIGKINISFTTGSIQIQNLKLTNPPEFGGSTFLDLPELYVEYDFEALRNNRLHLKNIRIHLSEIHIVQNKDGRKNTDLFDTQKTKKKSSNSDREKSDFQFDGIDFFEISVGEAKFSSALYPAQNFDRNLGIQNRTFQNVKTPKDLENVGLILAAQAGFNLLMQQTLGDSKAP